PTSRRKATAAIRSASAPISTALATGSSGSSTGSNNVVGWRRAMTGLLPTALPSFNSRQSGYGCALMSPHPNSPALYIRAHGLLLATREEPLSLQFRFPLTGQHLRLGNLIFGHFLLNLVTGSGRQVAERVPF